MKAALFHRFGGPDVLVHEEVPTPRPGPDEVLVKVLATGVNRLEHYIREGTVTGLPLPHVLGSDAVGVVTETGSRVTGFTPGDRVIPMAGYPIDDADAGFDPMCSAPSYMVAGVARWGSYAQYMTVPARWLVPDTSGVSPAEAATLPMVLVTAVRALKVVGEVKPGQRVLVHAGASGTGTTLIQVARALGARVATTVDDDRKAALAREVGAELVIDVRKQDFVEATRDWTEGRGLDVVTDNLGGPILQRSIKALRKEGIVVAMGFVAGVEVTFDVRDFFFAQKQVRGTLMGTVEDFRWGLEQVARGAIRPQLQAVLPLREAARAHQLLASNQVLGNIVLDPWAA